MASDTTENLLSHDIEMADSDVTVTLPNHQPSVLVEQLVSLPSPAPLSKLSKICPIPSQITSKIPVIPKLRPKSETDRAGLIQTNVASPRSPIVSASTEQIDTDNDLFIDIEQSGPNTGVTTASWQTELTSPVISILDDQMDLPWRQRMSQLGQDHSSPLLLPCSQRTEEAADSLTHNDARYPLTEDTTSKDEPSASAFPEELPALNYESAGPRLRPSTRPVAEIELVAGSYKSPESSLVTTASTPGFNPLALEWRPKEKTRDMSTKDSPKDSSRALPSPSEAPHPIANVVEESHARDSEQIDSRRVLEWAKNVPPLQLSGRMCIKVPSSAIHTLASAAITPSITDESRINRLDVGRQRNLFATPHTRTATLSDTTQLYQKPTLAQRRAEKQLGRTPLEFVQSAPSTTPLRSVKLHPLGYTSLSPAGAPFQAVHSPSLQVPPSRPFHLASHTQSLTWKRSPNPSSEYRSVDPEITRWTKAEQDLLKMGLIKRVPGKPDSGSFVVPKTFEQWLEFRAGRAEDALLENAEKIRQRNLESKDAEKLRRVHGVDEIRDYFAPNQGPGKRIKIEPAMGGKDFRDGRGTVLANASIWSPWYQPTEERPEAVWPSIEEMKEEGDERHTSAFGRFLALPRVPGNPTVVWKVKPIIPAIPFDEVWKLPNKDTWVELHRQKLEDPDEDYMEGLVGRSLLDAIDL